MFDDFIQVYGSKSLLISCHGVKTSGVLINVRQCSFIANLTPSDSDPVSLDEFKSFIFELHCDRISGFCFGSDLLIFPDLLRSWNVKEVD